MQLYLDEDVKKYFTSTQPLFDQVMALRGEVFRHQKGRLTQRIKLGDKYYFIKQHHGVGWKEIIKNIFQLRLPVIGASNEWLAIKKVQSLGVNAPKVVGYGQRGLNPAAKQSFILMEELAPAISLEDLCKDWKSEPPTFANKIKLLNAVATIARILHSNGINHRDFYLCHFLQNTSKHACHASESWHPDLYLIDLHRAQIRKHTPQRWICKDLAGLYFSSKDIGLTTRDLYRFMRIYRQKNLRSILTTENQFWLEVKNRGDKLYRDHL